MSYSEDTVKFRVSVILTLPPIVFGFGCAYCALFSATPSKWLLREFAWLIVNAITYLGVRLFSTKN